MRFIVIESGRRPTLHGVAVRAMSLAILGHKLVGVRVRVTRFTLLWRALISRFGRPCGFMALCARHRAVSAQQRELCFGMVEAVDIGPASDRVASLATEHGAVHSSACHISLELAFVWIGVARRAIAVFETEWQNSIRSSGHSGFVAARARNSGMRSG